MAGLRCLVTKQFPQPLDYPAFCSGWECAPFLLAPSAGGQDVEDLLRAAEEASAVEAARQRQIYGEQLKELGIEASTPAAPDADTLLGPRFAEALREAEELASIESLLRYEAFRRQLDAHGIDPAQATRLGAMSLDLKGYAEKAGLSIDEVRAKFGVYRKQTTKPE